MDTSYVTAGHNVLDAEPLGACGFAKDGRHDTREAMMRQQRLRLTLRARHDLVARGEKKRRGPRPAALVTHAAELLFF